MSKNWYEKLTQDHPDDPDFGGLDQGPVNTAKRHQLVLDKLDCRGNTLLDLGCGTGLLLEHLVSHGVTPSRYVGVDFLEARRHHVEARLWAMGVIGEFIAADCVKQLRAYRAEFDVVVACGLAGPIPFHTHLSIGRLMASMQVAGDHGLITVPRPYDDFLGAPYQAHFDPDDLRVVLNSRGEFSLCAGSGEMELHSPRELVMWW